ncbi:MAG TPA: hypothetical protein ENI76_09690 [Ignavibacteria bacterium]|nr:hypothetical protein [Ignavibacteria bacterium]
MATNDDIRIQKGTYDITLFTVNNTENWKNTVQVIPGVTTGGNQINQPNLPQVVDIQRTTYSYVFECGITSTATQTAKQVKDDVRIMFEGARSTGEPILLTYEDKQLSVYFEDCVVKKNSSNTVGNYSGEDSFEYNVTLTFVEGNQA